jgi:hypothetical protein
MLASSRERMPLTLSRFAAPPPSEAQAPCPRAPHQRRPSAGELTTPTTGSPSMASAISVPQIGTPRR